MNCKIKVLFGLSMFDIQYCYVFLISSSRVSKRRLRLPAFLIAEEPSKIAPMFLHLHHLNHEMKMFRSVAAGELGIVMK